MTNRFPLILDADSQKFQEIPAGDNLDLTGNNISAVRNIIPESNETYDLGSDQNRWKDLYLSGDTIFLGDAEIKVTEQDGIIFLVDEQQVGVRPDLNSKSTDDLSEGSNNLYYTDGRVDDHLSGGTGVTYNNGEISIGQDVGTDADVEFNDLEVKGAGTFSSTGAIILPIGTTDQRPESPVTGMFRFNNDFNRFEGYDGTEWVELQSQTAFDEGDLETQSGTIDLEEGSGAVDLMD